jgi:hypothetical protein
MLDGCVSAVMRGFESAGWLVAGRGAVMEAAMGERTTEPFVEEEEWRGDLNAFLGKAVGVSRSISMQQPVSLELVQIVAQLVEAIVFFGEKDGSRNDQRLLW